jgi:hypothetical protein
VRLLLVFRDAAHEVTRHTDVENSGCARHDVDVTGFHGVAPLAGCPAVGGENDNREILRFAQNDTSRVDTPPRSLISAGREVGRWPAFCFEFGVPYP